MGNIVTVTLPDIGEGVVEGEVIEWLKKEGDTVKKDEPVVIVMTDKATVELPAPQEGKLSKCYFKPGEKAILNKPLYDIEVTEPVSAAEKELPVVSRAKETPKVEQKAKGGKVLATPATRKMASELGVDISAIPGTGKQGQVTLADLRDHLQPESITMTRLPDDVSKQVMGIPALMAKQMAASKRLIPHFSYFEVVDATRLVQLRSHFKTQAEKERIHVTYMPFLIRALSLTIQRYGWINSCFDLTKSELILHQRHHVGIAMTTKQGLIVPVLKDVQNKNVEEIVRAFEELKEKALTGKLQPGDMKDATITISNYGVLGGGGMWATPIINPPETAILAVNKIQKQPLVKNDQIVIRDVINLSWSFDHRVIDGDLAANVSHHFANLIQNPAFLL